MHSRLIRRVTAVTAGVAAAALLGGGALASAAAPGHGSGGNRASIRHVLLISIDGFHASDLATCEAQGLCPNLASLARFGTTYTDAHTSEPSDSAPGLMALATGGDPKLTGV